MKTKCQDIKGTEKWDSEGHGENKPSSKEFKKMLKDDSVTICELAESIDHMNVKGEVKDWSDFKDTSVYLSTTDKVQSCLKDRMHLGDSLADYEIQKCATGLLVPVAITNIFLDIWKYSTLIYR